MPWMDWIAQKHSLFVHVPTVAALLMPLALVAAQRPGRGIKPWWVTCRYLAWAGVLGSLPAVLSGLQAAHQAKLLAAGQYLAKGAFENPTLFQLHQWVALTSFVLGLLTLRALFRRREEHQGIGILPLFLGVLWAASALMAAYHGHLLAHPRPAQVAKEGAAPKAPVPVDPEAAAPLRALDYASLVPMHAEPVKSAPHGNRWVRVWANAKAAEAYREGRALTEGSLVVMSTVEDRWGRPGFDPGPLYALETKADGQSSLTFYWAHVPEARRNETRGLDRAYWRGADPNLKACLECHAAGAAPLRDRSTFGIPKPKPKAEGEISK